LTLREYELIIYDDIKDAIAAGHQLCFYSKGIAQLVRQTGGSGLIVSLSAKMYINFHDVPPREFCALEIRLAGILTTLALMIS
jgi:hypothetical protein